MPPVPVIPETITVHLGRPDEYAENVTVNFTDYIKNVASHEIYPNWPEEALRANILAQITFALNRVYTEYYPSRGYDFDITSDTQYDQKFVPNDQIFENISQIVDEVFNNYIVRSGSIVPLYAQFCDGVYTQCSGLSQWGSVSLANQGYTAMDILRYYYGDNIELVYNAPVSDDIESYPGVPLSRGSFGDDVLTIKRELNRIAKNYPAIPRIDSLTGVYDLQTEEAVKEFQRIFNLDPDGIVGKATWYKIKQVYTSVKGLSEIVSEGLTISEVQRRYTRPVQIGSRGTDVEALQYYLAFLGYFYPELAPIPITGYFGEMTRDAVYAFQTLYGLTVDGIAGEETFTEVERAYRDAVSQLPPDYQSAIGEPYPGRFLVFGDSGDSVAIIQQYLARLSQIDPQIPPVSVTGTFDEATRDAVYVLQRELGIEQNGAIGPVEWSEIITSATNI